MNSQAHKFYYTALVVLAGISLVLLSLSGIKIYAFAKKYRDAIYPNITISNVPVGGKTLYEAQQIIGQRYPQNKPLVIELVLDNTPIATISGTELYYTIRTDYAVKQAYTIGRNPQAKFIDNLKTKIRLFTNAQKINILVPVSFKKSIIEEKLKKIQEYYTTNPIDARFEFQGGRVTTFIKERPGQTINIVQAQENIIIALKSNDVRFGKKRHINVPIEWVSLQPSVKLKDINNLNITELIAKGTSKFAGSSPERVYNIVLGAQRINGVIIQPGEEFSFVNTLGEISRTTGFKSSYIIKGGKTVLGDGGGICQVSTTVFRAVLNAGLLVTKRYAHSYRVGYYEQNAPPGYDATIYSPNVDFKFKNNYDTPVLLTADVDQTKMELNISFYGTKDNRDIIVTKPIVTNVMPPPPAQYIDDPTLPKGVVKQVDFAAPGGRSIFDYKVIKDNKTIINTSFISVYRPWRAVYLRGT